jgi:hypothetical protein
MTHPDWNMMSHEQKADWLRAQINNLSRRISGLATGMEDFAHRLVELEEEAKEQQTRD